ncbi:hypothetical protein SAMN04488505_101829 [Chitinophaga rupis]|uniref:Lipoprotein n=1 Tax=Chitinophaga rupis TaxID=573321 RepID=A0A1H7JLS1_9BACT|nr:hypothetical protein [Chitinophaga rupis]SEK75593.1 hypothetical protein SAMN04488505_101829 [Chitinophaga rupis]
MNPFSPRFGSMIRMALAVSFLFVACKKDDDDVPPPQYTVDQLYANSITDATIADNSEVVDTLWPITADNPNLQWKTIHGKQYVLMATFMKYPSSYPAGDSITNTWGDAWVFIPAQMKRRLAAAFKPGSDTIMRICQLLGLPPANDRSNTHISQMWVPADRLVRPAGNPAINTTTTGAVLVNGVSPDYATWFDNNIIYSYYRPLSSNTDYYYPWTRLGYTYDWAPDGKEVGLSEYKLQASSGIWVEQTGTAGSFFRN